MTLGHRGAEHCANQVPLLGLSTACELGDLRGAAPAGGDVPVDLRHAPPRAVGGHHEITHQGELQPAARTHAIHSSDRDRHHVVDHVDGVLVHADLPGEIVRPPVVELLDVIAGAERVAGPTKDHDATVSVD